MFGGQQLCKIGRCAERALMAAQARRVKGLLVLNPWLGFWNSRFI